MKHSKENNQTYSIYKDILKSTPYSDSYSQEAYIPYSENFGVLGKPFKLGYKTFANRIEYQPMEGQDALVNGSPTDITFNRYKELSRGGAGLIWFEAVAIAQNGKSNPFQLELKEDTLDEFRRLVDVMKEECIKENSFEPTIIMQMTHSGRYAKPNGIPEPIPAYFNSFIEEKPLNTYASDSFLKELVDYYVKSAILAEKVGFDGVDIKCCHGYLLSELLSAYDREGIYGGTFENRTRLILDIASAINQTLSKDMIRAVRLNIYDGYDDKYSFGEISEKANKDSEQNRLIGLLKDKGITLINVTMGSPYRNPDVSRPYRKGLEMPKSDSLQGLSRLLCGAEQIKELNPDIAIVNTGISLLGKLSPFAAAGLIEENMTDFVGFGRMSFAYPNLAKDIINNSFDEKKSCIACSGCSTLKKNIEKSGCIVTNPFYRKVYRDFKKREENK